jgi:hypothetical protein
VDEENRLGGALLAGMTVSILVALPSYVVYFVLVLRDVRPKYLPVIAAIFKSHLTV